MLPGLATTLPVLILTLTLTGVGSGLVDVGINANVGRIETETGARLMPLAHGIYSVGILVGAVGAGLARGAGVGREEILGAVAVLIALTGLVIATDDAPAQADAQPGFRLARALLLIGFLGAAAFVVEGGIESWSALFLERQFDAAAGRQRPRARACSARRWRWAASSGQALAASPTACCSVAARRSRRRLLHRRGVAPNAPLGLVGFALAGAGISLNAPIVFGIAGRRPDAASAVATVTTIGYLGLLSARRSSAASRRRRTFACRSSRSP